VSIKVRDFVGNILQNKFHACCYILLSDTRPKRRDTHSYLRRGYATLCVAGAKDGSREGRLGWPTP